MSAHEGNEELARSASPHYSKMLFEYAHGRAEAPSPQLLERIKWVADSIPTDVRSVLDLGAGRCHLSNLLVERGYVVTSTDIVLTALKNSKGHRAQSNSTELPFRTGSYDLVICAEVIEHMRREERLATLKEIWRVARRFVLLTVPNEENLSQMLIRCDRCKHVFHAWGHLTSFNRASMEAILPESPIIFRILPRPTRIYVSPLLAIRHKLFRTYGFDTYVVCPNCSNTEIAEPRRLFPVKVLDRLNYWLAFKRQAGWLLTLYEKPGVDAATHLVWPGTPKAEHKRRGMFARMDRAFMSLQSLSRQLENRLSWRLGRSVRGALDSQHEGFLRFGHRRGWCLVDPEILDSMASSIPAIGPRFPSLSPSCAEVSPRARELKQGICSLNGGATAKIEQLSWLPEPFIGGASNSRFLFHCLDWVRELLEAYHLTGDNGYLDQAKVMASRWISQCLYSERQERIWDDHITAIRALVLCQLCVACRKHDMADRQFITQLLVALTRHAERLAQKGFYRSGHNHGVTQAYALLAIAGLFPQLPEVSSWTKSAIARLEELMAENVTQEGIHREHSPYYHFYVFNQFFYAYQFGQAYGIEFSQAFTDRLKKMLACGAYILKPDGKLPALGDTCKSSPVLTDTKDVPSWLADAGQVYLYSQSMGKLGTLPEENSVYWPKAGVALLRSGWGTERKFEDEAFLAVRTRTFDTAHIHRDQLSFELYAYGDDLIVDSGGPYGYGEPMREFFLSTAAHNTVVVDGKEQGIGKAEILAWQTSATFDLLVAEQRNYPGVVHRRTILFVRPDYFVILDRLDAEDRHAYVQLFHLNPGLNARCANFAVTTTSPSHGPTVQIIPLLESDLAVKLYKGADHPTQGWVCIGERQKVVNTVVEYQRLGRAEEFAVLLVPQPAGVSTAVNARLETFSTGRRRILVVIGERQDEIVIFNDGRVTVGGVRDVC